MCPIWSGLRVILNDLAFNNLEDQLRDPRFAGGKVGQASGANGQDGGDFRWVCGLSRLFLSSVSRSTPPPALIGTGNALRMYRAKGSNEAAF